MSTKKQTNTVQANTYDKGSMNAFQGFTGQLGGYANQWLGAKGSTDPTATPGFNMMYQAMLNNVNAMAGRNVRNISANALALGSNPNSAATQAILARAGRSASGLQAGAYMNSYQNALNMQNQVAGMVGNYRPLQTGGTQNTTETTSGLGTWLPQLAGAAIGGAMSMMNPASAASKFVSAGPSGILPGANPAAPTGFAGVTGTVPGWTPQAQPTNF